MSTDPLAPRPAAAAGASATKSPPRAVGGCAGRPDRGVLFFERLFAVIAMLTLAYAIRLLGRRNVSGDRLRPRLDAGRIHPQQVVLGFGESQFTSVVGMGVFVGSSFQRLFLRIAPWRSGHWSERLG